MMLTNLNANIPGHLAVNNGVGRISPSTGLTQIKTSQVPEFTTQKMVRNFGGLGVQNSRQNQFTFVTANSPKKSVTEAEKKGKIENLGQFVEGVPESQIK